MDKPDYYAILGVGRDATPAEIRAAFERACAAPGGDENAALADAFAVLSDAGRRIHYDQQLYVAATSPLRGAPLQMRAVVADGARDAAPAVTAHVRSMRPRDAATLIMVDTTAEAVRILMGRRRDDVAFMPGKYVFPGGRVDKEDRLVEPADELGALEVRRLLHDMKGSASVARARAIALAAVRETFEEAGLVIGAPAHPGPVRARAWSAFCALGFRPRLAPLRLIARAITPPGRTRRYDTRFFTVPATAIAYRSQSNDGELSGLHWMTLEEARALDLPHITRVVLEDLGDRLREGAMDDAGAPVPYYHHKNGTFRRDLMPGP